MEIYLIRHAQSEPSHTIPDPQWPLSPLGQRQARALVPVLQTLEIAEVFTSPYRRCVSTVEPFVKKTGAAITRLDDLRERRISDRIVDNFPEIWQQSWDDFAFALPGCESSATAQARVCRVTAQICNRATGDAIGVSSHGNLIGLLLNALDSSFGAAQADAQRNPDICRLLWVDNQLSWDRSFCPPAPLDSFATDQRGISTLPN